MNKHDYLTVARQCFLCYASQVSACAASRHLSGSLSSVLIIISRLHLEIHSPDDKLSPCLALRRSSRAPYDSGCSNFRSLCSSYSLARNCEARRIADSRTSGFLLPRLSQIYNLIEHRTRYGKHMMLVKLNELLLKLPASEKSFVRFFAGLEKGTESIHARSSVST